MNPEDSDLAESQRGLVSTPIRFDLNVAEAPEMATRYRGSTDVELKGPYRPITVVDRYADDGPKALGRLIPTSADGMSWQAEGDVEIVSVERERRSIKIAVTLPKEMGIRYVTE